MSYLIEKAKKDIDVVKSMRAINDELYLDVCCYHTQQAIEKLLNASIELKGLRYSFTHAIITLYSEYLKAGWKELPLLEMMSGTITDWEASSRYKESFYATSNQLKEALSIYNELETRLLEYLNSTDNNNSNQREMQEYAKSLNITYEELCDKVVGIMPTILRSEFSSKEEAACSHWKKYKKLANIEL